MRDLSDTRIGMVLSGGGAKGAYQIGMFRALEEAGLRKEKLVLAGTSIGAMMAFVYAAGDTDLLWTFLNRLGKAFRKLGGSSGTDQKEQDRNGMFLDFWRDLLPDEKLMKSRVPVTVCCYSRNREMPVYFHLSDYDYDTQRLLVTASGSLPGVLPGVRMDGDLYTDGGVVPEGMEHPQPADKIPVRALQKEKIGLEIVSYLTQDDRTDPEAFCPGAEKLELWPSKPLEERPHSGTLDFSESTMKRNEALGYEDTRAVLAGQQ